MCSIKIVNQKSLQPRFPIVNLAEIFYLCPPIKNNAMENILQIAEQNQQKARNIIQDTRLIEIWESIGAEPRLVGSLKTGLLMKHRDIDFHIYSAPLTVSDSFAAMARLAENPGITQIQYGNLLDTEEKCIEWHAYYRDSDKQLWQIDMIHILKGSTYDGYFEKMAERITAVLTPETREAILRLKYETPDTEKIIGVEYYQAVIRDGIRNYTDFTIWRKQHPVTGIVKWIP